MLYHCLKAGLRLLVVLLIAAIGFGIYLYRRPNTGKFIQDANKHFTEALGAKSARLNNFKLTGGSVQIRAVEADGGPDSFFNTLDASGVSFEASLLDGFLKRWETTAIHANKLVMDLRVGADTKEEADKMADGFIQQYPGFTFSAIDGSVTTLHWGLRSKTSGSINDSKMLANRTPDGWELNFTGGTFSQNWLHDLKIKSINAQVSTELISIPKALFEDEKTGGTVSFTNVKIAWSETPRVSGKVKLVHIPISNLVPESSQNLIEGTVSGELTMGGSTNSSEGVTFTGNLLLDEGDTLTMRDTIYLFKALSVVDGNNNYQRANFNEGSFSLKSSNGAVVFSNIELKSELVAVKGGFTIRPSTMQEAQQQVGAAGKNDGSVFTPIGETSASAPKNDVDSLLTLEKAGEKTSKKSGFKGNVKDFESDRQRQIQDSQSSREASLLRELNSLRFDGKVQLLIPGNAFEQASELQKLYPVDSASGKTPMLLTLDGNLNAPTQALADKILELGKRKH